MIYIHLCSIRRVKWLLVIRSLENKHRLILQKIGRTIESLLFQSNRNILYFTSKYIPKNLRIHRIKEKFGKNKKTIRNVLYFTLLQFHSTLHLHRNPLVQSLSSLTLPLKPPRRLRRCWPRDLLK